ncbi:MAG: acetyl-CoA C-acyltransferase [Flavobacteriales bacterium]|nr:acetyl-CoA C-acyltransferase [Flavobacteriales bacterium]
MTKRRQAVIVATARTPIGSFCGTLKDIPATTLGSIAIEGAFERTTISKNDVDEVFMGCVLTAGLGQSPAKQAALGAGLLSSVPCTTINKVCASGMKALMLGAASIELGDNEIVVVGGMENMSMVPHYLPTGRSGQKYGNVTLVDGMLYDGLTDVYSNEHMGLCGEACAEAHGITREEQDAFAIESYTRSAKAWSKGAFDNEIVPVEVKDRKGNVSIMSEDEEYKHAKLDKIPLLRAAFKKDGTITAANASTINDGAAALILMSEEKAKELNIKPLARIISYADASQEPKDFPTSPTLAAKKALSRADMDVKDVDYWEINEAFSVVGIVNTRLLDIDKDHVNIYGGGVSLGHPLGSSGARILVTLMTVLSRKNAHFGCAAVCNGGGGASAVVIERVL